MTGESPPQVPSEERSRDQRHREIARALRLDEVPFDKLPGDDRRLALETIREIDAFGPNWDGLLTVCRGFVKHHEDFESTFVVIRTDMHEMPGQDDVPAAVDALRVAGIATPEQERTAASIRDGVQFLQDERFEPACIQAGQGVQHRRGGPRPEFAETVLGVVVALHLEARGMPSPTGAAARFLGRVAVPALPSSGPDSDLVRAWRKRIDRAAQFEHAVTRARQIAAHARLDVPPI